MHDEVLTIFINFLCVEREVNFTFICCKYRYKKYIPKTYRISVNFSNQFMRKSFNESGRSSLSNGKSPKVLLPRSISRYITHYK